MAKLCGKCKLYLVPDEFNYCALCYSGESPWPTDKFHLAPRPLPATLGSGASPAMKPQEKITAGKLAPVAAESLTLREYLRRAIVGQDDVVEGLGEALDMYDAGLASLERPVYSALLLGPTGTGKTFLAESLAKALHGSRKLLVVNCGEYQMEHEVAKLIGAPPGYLGHRETVALLSQKRVNDVCTEGCPLSVILFDEIEKSSHAMGRLLLGILDKATLSLGDGATVDFSETIILMTSNLGAGDVQLGGGIGLPSEASATRPLISHESLKRRCEGAARKHFPAEFINRLDALWTFKLLTRADLREILEALVAQLQERLDLRDGAKQSVYLDVTGPAKKWLLDNGTDPRYGARDLRRLLERKVLRPAAALLLEYPRTTTLRVQVVTGGIEVESLQ